MGASNRNNFVAYVDAIQQPGLRCCPAQTLRLVGVLVQNDW